MRKSIHSVRPAIGFAILVSSLPVACRVPEADDPLLREPVISIDARAFSPFLEQTAQLAGTPAARYSRTLLDRAASCGELWAHFDSPGFDFTAHDCPEPSIEASKLAVLVREARGEADGFISWPIGDDGRLALRLDVDLDGGLSIDGTLVAPSEPGAYAIFVPGSLPPAEPALAPSATLLHLRMRPANGIGLSDLIPAGSQADRLFALKGRLLEGALLSGTWEFAFMPPAPGGEMPLAVGALHHRLAGGLEAALDEALNQLETTWPIRRSPRTFTLADGSSLLGGCFLDLPLLPELAPCWLVTPDALLMGYRAEAIEAALAAPAVSSAGGDRRTEGEDESRDAKAAARLDIHLDRLERVDATLLGPDATPHPGEFFSKFELRMSAGEEGRITLHARIRPRS